MSKLLIATFFFWVKTQELFFLFMQTRLCVVMMLQNASGSKIFVILLHAIECCSAKFYVSCFCKTYNCVVFLQNASGSKILNILQHCISFRCKKFYVSCFCKTYNCVVFLQNASGSDVFAFLQHINGFSFFSFFQFCKGSYVSYFSCKSEKLLRV